MATISGIATDSTGTPGAYVIDITERATGRLAARVVSDSLTGAYSATITGSGLFVVKRYNAPVLPVDANLASCSLALHMCGQSGSRVFIDERGKAVQVFGNTKISNTVGIIDGVAGYFDGSGDYLVVPASADFQFGTGNFTLRGKIYVTAWNGGYSDFANAIIDTRDSVSGGGVLLMFSTAGKLRVYNTATVLESATAVPLNTLTDFEVSRTGGTLRIFLNGVLDASVANSTNFTGQSCTIGAPVDGKAETTYLKFGGYMKDILVFKGVALHTATFTPATTLFASEPRPGAFTENAQIFDYVTPV